MWQFFMSLNAVERLAMRGIVRVCYDFDMSKAAAIIVLAFFSAFLPFTGFPGGVKLILAVVFGLSIMALGFLVRQERIWLLRALSGEHKTDAYTESGASYAHTPSS